MLVELNGIEIQAADVGNMYLEAAVSTSDKVYFIAGPKFGE